jgi:hypothetical protein
MVDTIFPSPIWPEGKKAEQGRAFRNVTTIPAIVESIALCQRVAGP